MPSKAELRKAMRNKRKSLTQMQHQVAGDELAKKLLPILLKQKLETIAVYWPTGGEINPMKLARHSNIKAHLPVIQANKKLLFRLYDKNTPLKKNQFSIPEPTTGELVKARQLDAIIIPVVAFDRQGNRIGMGGGFYDRTLANIKNQAWRQKPVLIGVAHHFQEVKSISSDSWDITLETIATDKEIIPVK